MNGPRIGVQRYVGSLFAASVLTLGVLLTGCTGAFDDSGGAGGSIDDRVGHLAGVEVTGLTLVDAASDSDIGPLEGGAVVDLSAVGESLNIRADVSGTTDEVHFELDGDPNHRQEGVAPYALFGDSPRGDYYSWTPDTGRHSVTATPYVNGSAGQALSIDFNVTDGSTASPIDLVLVDAASDTDLRGLGDADTIDLAAVGSELSIRAEPQVGGHESVRFGLDGQSNYQTENVPAYAIGGNTGEDYDPWTPSEGTHTLVVTVYPGDGASGTALASRTIEFTVVDGPPADPCDGVTCDMPPSDYCDGDTLVSYQSSGTCDSSTGQCSYGSSRNDCSSSGKICQNAACVQTASPIDLVLVDAASDTDLRGLGDTNTIDLAAVGSELSIRAEPQVSGYQSVRFGVDGASNFQTENVAPYAIAGDTSGDYDNWTPSVGAHVITVSAYAGSDGSGQSLASRTINLEVVNGTPPPPPPPSPGGVTGELKTWHTVEVNFDGPQLSEQANSNPFLDYRLQVTFTHVGSQRQYVVPGFFAADGQAADTGATSGRTWRARFTPDASGEWTYSASFRTGYHVAVDRSASAGTPTAFDGSTGSFTISPTDKSAPDMRAKGRLAYVSGPYLQFMGNGEYFLKGGPGSPENFLGYNDFDQTPNGNHHYNPHAGDWSSGDPTWRGGQGKEIIGAVNYLASQGMTSMYLIAMTANGDGDDVWPWTSKSAHRRFDVSKLAQWDIVFSYMNHKGINVHMLQQETENDQLLDGGSLGVERKVYYRELAARFGHLNGLIWNLGEENTNSTSQREAFSDYIRAVDPFDHVIVMHTYPNDQDNAYDPLLGQSTLGGTSLQTGPGQGYSDTLEWRNKSASAGHPWAVFIDEFGSASRGAVTDSEDPDHDSVRKGALWANLMAGGGGVEWYFGYDHPHNDLNLQDFRSRDNLFDQTRYALEFFQNYLPFAQMAPQQGAIPESDGYVLAKGDQIKAVYLKNGGTVSLNLSSGAYDVRWFDPRHGGGLQTGSLSTVSGGQSVSLGQPPSSTSSDWVALVSRQ